MERYRQISHTADLGAIIYGRDIPELFRNAAFAMFDMMSDMDGLKPEWNRNVEVKAPDTEGLLISWLNELLYISGSEQVMFTEFNLLKMTGNELHAEIKGIKPEEYERRIRTEIKAATYHDIKIEKVPEGYEVTIIFDV